MLGLTIIEAFGALFNRDFALPIIGQWAVIGFLEDFFAVAVLCGIVTFAIMRVRQAPSRRQRAEPLLRLAHAARRLVSSMMIVAASSCTLLLYRAAQINTGHFPFGDGLGGLRLQADLAAAGTRSAVAANGGHRDRRSCSRNVGVILAFLILVTYSKHLHIGLAPINVAHQAASPTRSARCCR